MIYLAENSNCHKDANRDQENEARTISIKHENFKREKILKSTKQKL